ncbi:Heat shock protein [Sparassis crispa]|uniref:Heat shock protein n=1 Tax=Sparassis crispa TaxID=139825 RepID=A0A401GYD5_9APHY|nr:Heat shock protein [Sparassis crispa]GBE87217.1 Heat shock protein [Sparassis crispa]
MARHRIFYDSLPFSQLDRLIEEALTSEQRSNDNFQLMNGSQIWRPRMDVHEDLKHNRAIATFELPGLQHQDVGLEFLNGNLTVSGELKPPAGINIRAGVRERRYGKFARVLFLPSDVKPEDIKAAMENGILTVKYPLTSARHEPPKIADP